MTQEAPPADVGPPPVALPAEEERPEVFDHLGSTLNDSIAIILVDEPDPADQAHHQYVIEVDLGDRLWKLPIYFQHGAVNDGAPRNGLSEESLLAIVLHRMTCFQRGPYACRENAQARNRVQEALMWLKERTARRLAEGTEGHREKG